MQSLARGGREPWHFPPGPLAEVGQKMFGHEEDVVAPGAQRRQFERDHVEAKIQILAKFFRPHHFGQILIRGGQHADFGVNGRGTADAKQNFFFQHAEQFRLAGQAQIADLVEEQCPAGGEFEFSCPGFPGVGEGPFFMAEQFAFGQGFGNSRAINGNKRLIAAPAEIMDRLGHDLLARAVFAQDQHGQIGVGHSADDRAEGVDSRTFADQTHAFGGLFGNLTVGRKQYLPVLGVFQGHGGMRGQFDQGFFIFNRKTAGEFVDQFEGPEQLALPASQRHAEQGPRLVMQLGVDPAVDGLRFGGHVNAPGFARLDHLSHHAAIVGDAQFAAWNTQGRPAHKRMVRSDPKERCSPDRRPTIEWRPRPCGPAAARPRGFYSIGRRFPELPPCAGAV